MYKVMIVDDEEILRNGLTFIIDWAEFDCKVVAMASNGIEAIEKIEQYKPDIVLLDVNMPILNGIDMLKTYDGQHLFSTIIISGYDEFEYVQSAIQQNVSDYLLKPIGRSKLINALQKAKDDIEMKKLFVNKKNEIQIQKEQLFEILPEMPTKNTEVTTIIKYVHENYMDKISINDLVEKLNKSKSYLNQVFKKNMDMTFNEYLNRFRIGRAIEKIAAEEGKISIIAEEVGFNNYRYFVDVFKKYTGMLPSDFINFQKQEE